MLLTARAKRSDFVYAALWNWHAYCPEEILYMIWWKFDHFSHYYKKQGSANKCNVKKIKFYSLAFYANNLYKIACFFYIYHNDQQITSLILMRL